MHDKVIVLELRGSYMAFLNGGSAIEPFPAFLPAAIIHNLKFKDY